MSKSKSQGTAFESWIVKWLVRIGLPYAERIAEGGSKDIGDVKFERHFDDDPWIIEAKATQTLNVTRVLGKARSKSSHPQTTILMWKRLVKLKDGQKKRRPDGEAIVIVMGLDTFERLVAHPDD